MYIKIHNTGDRAVIAVADKELIGKTIEENNLELKITERFYKGEEKTEEEIIEILKKATNVNLVGKKTINAALKAGVISKENILTIQNIPHAQYTTR